MLIEDGRGRGTRAAVDAKHRLDTHAESEDRRENFDSGKAWSMSFDAIDPAGADDYFVYLSNTSAEDYVITDLRLSSTVAGILEIHKVTGTPSYVSESSLDITSRNMGAAVVPGGVYNSDVDITGLTSQGILFFLALEVGKTVQLKTSSGLLLTPGTSIALRWDTGTGVLTGSVSMFFANIEAN
jgi:hypothetical protein